MVTKRLFSFSSPPQERDALLVTFVPPLTAEYLYTFLFTRRKGVNHFLTFFFLFFLT